MEQKEFKPLVGPESDMKELSLRAVLLGVIMAVCMGAANAFLGLKAGMTIAATYTTAVVGMAVIKALKGTILEENCARTVGSIGGNVASGAIFTFPALFIAGIWLPFYTHTHYLVCTIILIAGGILGIMFVTVTRRILVNNPELPFPESVAAAEIHKAGQRGAGGFKYLLQGIGVGIFFTVMAKFSIIAAKWQQLLSLGKGAILVTGPKMSPSYLGVGYIIGPQLSGINFSGGILAWGLLAPVIAFCLHSHNLSEVDNWTKAITVAWGDYVRYIAIGGMLVGAFYTLYKMRKGLLEGVTRSFANFIPGKNSTAEPLRTDRDIKSQKALIVILGIVVLVYFLFKWFSGNTVAAIVATVVMLFFGFIFAAVSGYLVGIIGVSSNPTSGLTVAVLIVVAFLGVLLGLEGSTGIAAVLGIAAFTCVSVSVAGEMMQDLKAGQMLGCTPYRMQVGDIFGVVAASLAMFPVLFVLHIGDIKEQVSSKLVELEKKNETSVNYEGKHPKFEKRAYALAEIKNMAPEAQNEILGTNAGLGGNELSAPQASLMARVAESIMEKQTKWILVLSGMLLGLGFILMQVKSPMLVSVGMYLPIETSFAIFLGGLFKGIANRLCDSKKLSPEEKTQANNTGTLLSAGLIAGEALIGILFAALAFADMKLPKVFAHPSYLASIIGIVILGALLIIVPLKIEKKAE